MSIEKSFNFISKDIEYQATVHAQPREIRITITNLKGGMTWIGNFTESYIEELTRKTGNYMQFPNVVKLLYACLEAKRSNVRADFLSYHDLEHLRNKQSFTSTPPKISNKRYLIISHITEFEKINYPLPLVLQSDRHNPKSEKNEELMELKIANHHLEKENRVLKEELDSTSQENYSLKQELEDLNNKYKGVEAERNQLLEEHERIKKELDNIIGKLEIKCIEKSDLKNMENAVKKQEKEIKMLKEENEKLRNEMEQARISKIERVSPDKEQEEIESQSGSDFDGHVDYPQQAESPEPISPNNDQVDRDSAETRVKQSVSASQNVDQLLSKLTYLCNKYKAK
ncbi:unnamed protein product [Blepharisma stoltei]|uniref:Uncharacterized protein n=1 Tax=Blepharisma stoltei TaxID=1481888 RepID=A0AAU9K2K0_9CILI|nr:unnamed protein product [Blepharisma stoltei]